MRVIACCAKTLATVPKRSALQERRPPGPVKANGESRRRKGHLDAGVLFDILLAVRAIVRNGACREIDLVANHTCLPGGGKKFRKRALRGLVRCATRR